MIKKWTLHVMQHGLKLNTNNGKGRLTKREKQSNIGIPACASQRQNYFCIHYTIQKPVMERGPIQPSQTIAVYL